MKHILAVCIIGFMFVSCFDHDVMSSETTARKVSETTTQVEPSGPSYCECGFSKIDDRRTAPFLLWSNGGSASLRKKDKFIDMSNIEEDMGTKLGEVGTFSFSNKEIVLKGEVTVTETCTGNEGYSCESISYKGTVEKIEGGKKTLFPVWGSCGC